MPTSNHTKNERILNWGSVIMGLVILIIAMGIIYYYAAGSGTAANKITAAPASRTTSEVNETATTSPAPNAPH